jgi:hypothetical protein
MANERDRLKKFWERSGQCGRFHITSGGSRLYRRPALRLPVRLHAEIPAGNPLRIRQSRFRPAWPCAGAPRRQKLRGAGGGTHLRPTRPAQHPHQPHRRDAIALGAGSQSGSGPVPQRDAAMVFPDAGRRRRRAVDGERPDRVPRSLPRTPAEAVAVGPPDAARNPAADRPSRQRDALGWFVTRDRGDEIAWKSGLTLGFNTFIGFSTSSHRGSIVLSNAAPHDSVEPGLHLINPDYRPKGIPALFHRILCFGVWEGPHA